MKNSVVKIALLVIIIVFTVGIIVAVYDSRLHNVKCEKLPTLDEVEQIVKEHQDLINDIENVNPGFIRIYIDSYSSCPGKGVLVVEYASNQDRLRIKELIGDTFFGVPLKLINT